MPGVAVGRGMKNIPAIGQSEHLEEATAISPARIEAAARAVLNSSPQSTSSGPSG